MGSCGGARQLPNILGAAAGRTGSAGAADHRACMWSFQDVGLRLAGLLHGVLGLPKRRLWEQAGQEPWSELRSLIISSVEVLLFFSNVLSNFL